MAGVKATVHDATIHDATFTGRKAKSPVPRQARKGQFFLYAFLNLSWNFRIGSGKHTGKIALT